MSNLAYTLSGNAPVIKRFKVGATIAAGHGVLERSTAGVAAQTTTSLADAVGMSIDLGTYTTTQSASMTEGVVSTIINPDAVYRSLMVSAATGNTQLALTTNSAAATNGLTITITTGDAAPNSPEMAGGLAYCVSGNNVGESRVITSTGATTATLTVPFRYTIAVGDTFILVPWSAPGTSSGTATFTTDLLAVRGDQAGTGTATLQVADVEIDVNAPRSNSKLLWLINDHVYNNLT